jgi:hemerythrin superfamily protein
VTTTQEQDVVDLLLEQHDQIRSLFSQVQSAQGETKRDLFEDLVRLLAVHESAEEEIVHPFARRKLDDGDQVVDARLVEEDEAKHVLAELYDLGVDHPEFDAKLAAFAMSVNEHATHEESEEFLHLRQTVEPDRLRRMAGALKAAEATAPTRPHPHAPESAAGNVLAGPPLAIFDRIRDTMRDWRQRNRDDD